MKTTLQISLFLNATLLTSLSFAQAPVFPPSQVPLSMPAQTFTPSYSQAPHNPYPQMMPPQAVAPRAAVNQLQQPANEFSGYLGIVIDVLPSSVLAQLPQGVTQGILVKSFASDSPAINSDLKPYDVIFSYDNTRLNHPTQFIKLVRNDKPGRTVTFKVIRKGQILEIPVTLGSQKTPSAKEFNGLAIKQLGKNKYEALIRYIGVNGNKQMRSYKGTRQEIFEQAINARDLPEAERQQLLYATRPRKGNSNSNSGFGSFFPFGGKNESGKDWMNPGRFFKW